jgi:hypothetical protein
MRRLILVVGFLVALGGTGVATAAMLSSVRSSSPTPEEKQPNEVVIRGGPISRVHAVSECKIVDVSTLPGNWTHGDYVSAVAGSGDGSLVPTAAHSDCGKPTVAIGHQHGPPDFARQKIEAHRSGGAEPQETPGS